MGRFDFISDEEFRNSLDSDAIEVHRCMQAKAWKAVHVLVGSMIECLLMDYLYTIGLKGNTREHLLKMDLNQLIELCAGERISPRRRSIFAA